jgi:hypothetical protein
MQSEAAWDGDYPPLLARQIHRPDRAIARATFRSGEPHFLSLRRPRQTAFPIPTCRKCGLMSGQVDNANRTAVIPTLRMI